VNVTPFRPALLALLLPMLVPGQALMAVTRPEQNMVKFTLAGNAPYPMVITLVSGTGKGADAIVPDDGKPAMKTPMSAYLLDKGKTVTLTFACNQDKDAADYLIKVAEFRGNGGGDPSWVQFAASKPADSGGLAALRWLTLMPKFEAGCFALAAPVSSRTKAQIKAMFTTGSTFKSTPSTMDLGLGFTAAPPK